MQNYDAGAMTVSCAVPVDIPFRGSSPLIVTKDRCGSIITQRTFRVKVMQDSNIKTHLFLYGEMVSRQTVNLFFLVRVQVEELISL